jgi:hypothetical protein
MILTSGVQIAPRVELEKMAARNAPRKNAGEGIA